MKVLWALLGSTVYKMLRRKTFDKDHFILLSIDYNDIADSHLYCEETKGSLTKEYCEIDLGISSKIFVYNNCIIFLIVKKIFSVLEAISVPQTSMRALVASYCTRTRDAYIELWTPWGCSHYCYIQD